MGEEKKPMPVDGSGTEPREPDANGELASRRDGDMPSGEANPGESGGGHYPNPYDGSNGQEPPGDDRDR